MKAARSVKWTLCAGYCGFFCKCRLVQKYIFKENLDRDTRIKIPLVILLCSCSSYLNFSEMYL